MAACNPSAFLPPAVAKTIYENISAGDPVLCYHLDGTESASTSGTKKDETAATTAAATTAAPETTVAPTTAAPSAGSNYGPGYAPETTAAHAETNQAPSDMGLIAPNGQ